VKGNKKEDTVYQQGEEEKEDAEKCKTGQLGEQYVEVPAIARAACGK
jgi:hypothetical protein